MAKRYHESKGKVRMHRDTVGEDLYAGADVRRRQERDDAMMISEDHNAVANLPQHVIQKDWARPYNRYAKFELDDTMRGIDKQEDEDGYEMKKHLQPGKY